MLRDPALASARLIGKDGGAGTALHLVTDWPGYFPSGPEIVQLLINAGADPNVKTSGRDSPGPGDETPLHYAASNDDVDMAEAENVSQAFWHACTVGQRRAADYLLSRSPDLNCEPDYAHGTPLDAASVLSTRQENVISWLREMGARSASSDWFESAGYRRFSRAAETPMNLIPRIL